MTKLSWQIASDVHRNTISLELWDDHGQHLADVVRCDNSNQLEINTYGNDLDFSVIQAAFDLAVEHLGAFEDGTPLTEATSIGEVKSY